MQSANIMPKRKMRPNDYLECDGRIFVRQTVVLEMTTWSRWTLWRQAKAGRFPAPYEMAARPWWALDEIESWLRGQFSQRFS